MVNKMSEKNVAEKPKKLLTRIAEYLSNTQQDKETLFYEKAQKAMENFYFDVISERASKYNPEEIEYAVDILKEMINADYQNTSWIKLSIETGLAPRKSGEALRLLTEDAGLLDVDELKGNLHEYFKIYSLSKDGKELKKAMSVY